MATAYRVPVTRVATIDELAPALDGLVGGGVRVVLMRTDRKANVAIHREINTSVADAIRA